MLRLQRDTLNFNPGGRAVSSRRYDDTYSEYWPEEKEAISDEAITTTMVHRIQENTIEKMRRVSLEVLPKARFSRQVTPPLTPTRIGRYVRESADQCMEEDPFFSERPDLVERAMADVPIKYPKIDPSDLMGDDFFGYNSADSRMDDWVKQACISSSHEVKLKKGTFFEVLPEDQQRYSCFRYALARAGISFEEEAMKDFQGGSLLAQVDEELLDVLQAHFTPVDAPVENGLVLFCAQGRPCHLGIYLGGQILSKEGDWSPFAYSRPLEDFGCDYGDDIIYWQRIRFSPTSTNGEGIL